VSTLDVDVVRSDTGEFVARSVFMGNETAASKVKASTLLDKIASQLELWFFSLKITDPRSGRTMGFDEEDVDIDNFMQDGEVRVVGSYMN
tara:strand:+ start:1969 stop:2238 length:270 start_codon:yes stop_codon:yes gene_type:complete